MWLRNVLIVCCITAYVIADKDATVKSSSVRELARRRGPVDAPTSRVVPVEEFVTSHKVPDSVVKPDEDEPDKRTPSKDTKHGKKVVRFETLDKKPNESIRRLDTEVESEEKNTEKRQARVELENFGDTGVLHEDGIRKIDNHRSRVEGQKDSVIPGVYISAEYPTTMMPVLTTPREARSFDFVPVNIIREDGKDIYAPFSDRNFGDLGDVSLVPAGTNSRIQVKKGPNGKDYEYEYVYYYYDEEDESKAGTAGSAVTNSYDIPSRTTSATRRSGTSTGRNKYNSAERSSTVEPASNEVIPNRNRGRQLTEAEDVSEERLPTNTRFPPRSRSNHNTGTTEPSRARGNRPRPGLDLVDSSSFRTHQEGPEFPQVLPKGPVRFLGVTPNEDNEEKHLARGRGRPQRVQEPAPVEEIAEDVPAPASRRRLSTTASPEIDAELNRGQPTRSNEEAEEEHETSVPLLNKQASQEKDSEEVESASLSSSTAGATDSPTTEYPSAMDKVALDLYAFLQQGQSNLIDASSSEASDSGESTTLPEDDLTTDQATTTELSATTVLVTEPTTTTTTTTTTEPTTTTTTTTEPTTTTSQAPVGRGKFRRPGVPGTSGSRTRFKSNGSTTTTTEEPTQRTRSRFGNGSNGSGFKRPRPGHKHTAEEDTVQKESSSSVNAEKPSSSRSRFRSTISTRPSSTTSAPSNGGSQSGPSGISRPSFNKLNINRRRGRPTTSAPNTSEEEPAHSETGQTVAQTAHETVTAAPKARPRLPATGVRPVIRPGGGPRVNLRQKPGQTTTTTTPAPETPESSAEEPTGEGTEEETHEAPAETSPPPSRSTTVNPLNKLRNRNRLQVHPKTTTRSPVSLAPRRSPLLPRRKVTEAPVVQTSQEDTSEEEPAASAETEATESTSSAETSTAASTKHEETRGLSSLLASRRRIAPRRPGQLVSRE